MQTFKKLPIEAPKQKASAQRNQPPESAAAEGVMATKSVLTAIVQNIGRQTRILKRKRGMDSRPSPVGACDQLRLRAGQRRGARGRTAVPGAGVARGAGVRAGDRERRGGARAGQRGQRRRREARQCRTARTVRLVIDEVGFLTSRGVPNVGHELAAVAALTVRCELRDRDRGENADDRYHDEELDQRKALLLLSLHLGQIAHTILPRVVGVAVLSAPVPHEQGWCHERRYRRGCRTPCRAT